MATVNSVGLGNVPQTQVKGSSQKASFKGFSSSGASESSGIGATEVLAAAGAAAGVAGLIMALKKGKGGDAVDKAAKVAEEAKKVAQDAIEKAKKAAKDEVEGLNKKLDDVEKAIKEAAAGNKKAPESPKPEPSKAPAPETPRPEPSKAPAPEPSKAPAPEPSKAPESEVVQGEPKQEMKIQKRKRYTVSEIDKKIEEFQEQREDLEKSLKVVDKKIETLKSIREYRKAAEEAAIKEQIGSINISLSPAGAGNKVDPSKIKVSDLRYNGVYNSDINLGVGK